MLDLNPIIETVIPAFEHMHWRYRQLDERTVITGFRDAQSAHQIEIRYFPESLALLLRVHAGLYLRAIDQESGLAELALALNERRFFLKLGRDQDDGEFVLDIEIPLLSDRLSQPRFSAFFIAICGHISSTVASLSRVHWGATTVTEALNDENNTAPLPNLDAPQMEDAPAALSSLEREILTILERLEAEDERGTDR